MTSVTDPLSAWTAAFVAAQAELPTIPKNRKVNTGQYRYEYADLPSIIAAVRPVLEKHGLAFAQSETPMDGGDIGIETRIYHRDGHVEVFGPLPMPAGGNAQAMGSAITYGRRYALCAALGIAADEDDDAVSVGAGRSRPKSSGSVTRPADRMDAHTDPDPEVAAEATTRGSTAAIPVPLAPFRGPDGEAAEAVGGEATSSACPPHDPDMGVEPKAGGRRPCRKCGIWTR